MPYQKLEAIVRPPVVFVNNMNLRVENSLAPPAYPSGKVYIFQVEGKPFVE